MAVLFIRKAEQIAPTHFSLAVDDALHEHEASAPTVSMSASSIAVNDSLHGHAADVLSLSTSPPPGTALALAAAALSSGQSASFTQQTSFSEDDIAWQTAFYHDEVRRRVHLMAKRQNDADAWGHQYYDEVSDTFGHETASMWNNDGHVYGNTAYDPATGDVFQLRNLAGENGRRARWWKHSLQNWNSLAPVSQDIYNGAMNDTPNGLAWHPNLFGPGDGGWAWGDQVSFLFWRKNTDAVSRRSIGTDEYGAKEGAAVYWPAQDCLVMGGSTPSGHLARIDANGGDIPIVTDLGVPVIRTQGASHEGGGGFGSLHVHPGNASKLILVETAGPRAWTTTNGSSWTQVSNHPFTRVPRVVCSTRGGYGVLWAIGRDDTGNFSTIYKPAV